MTKHNGHNGHEGKNACGEAAFTVVYSVSPAPLIAGFVFRSVICYKRSSSNDILGLFCLPQLYGVIGDEQFPAFVGFFLFVIIHPILKFPFINIGG